MGGGLSDLHIEYQGDGLKIWAARGFVSRYADPPAWQGPRPSALAREVYGVHNPEEARLAPF